MLHVNFTQSLVEYMSETFGRDAPGTTSSPPSHTPYLSGRSHHFPHKWWTEYHAIVQRGGRARARLATAAIECAGE